MIGVFLNSAEETKICKREGHGIMLVEIQVWQLQCKGGQWLQVNHQQVERRESWILSIDFRFLGNQIGKQ